MSDMDRLALEEALRECDEAIAALERVRSRLIADLAARRETTQA